MELRRRWPKGWVAANYNAEGAALLSIVHCFDCMEAGGGGLFGFYFCVFLS